MGIFDGAIDVLAGFRQDAGSPTIWNGTTYYATVATLDPTQVPDLIPDGDDNAADVDCRAFVYSPSVFGTGAKPDKKSVITLNGLDYIISRAYLTPNGTGWKCEGYRHHAPGTSSQDAAQKAKFDYVAPT